jgi:hypothetical protein
MYLARHVGTWSTPEIGGFYNGRHHTTVLYAMRRMERLRNDDPALAALIEKLVGILTPRVGEGVRTVEECLKRGDAK